MNPIPLLVVVILVIGFESLLFGEEFTARSQIVTMPEINNCDGETGLGAVGCGIIKFLQIIYAGLAMIANVIAFLFNAATFNVPGAPMIVRVVVGTFFSGMIVWSIVANLMRGSSA